MEQLIQLVTEKTGISKDQAKNAIETVLAFLKDKLPMGIGEKLESYVEGGESPAGDLLGGLKDKIGGLF